MYVYIYISNYIYIYIWDVFNMSFGMGLEAVLLFCVPRPPTVLGFVLLGGFNIPRIIPRYTWYCGRASEITSWQMVNIPWFCLGFIRFQPSFWWCRISQPHRDFFCEWQATYSHDSHGTSARPTAEEKLFFPHHPHLRATQRSSTFGSFQAPLLVQAGFHPSLLTYLHTAHGPKQKKHNMHHSFGLSDALWNR